MKRTWGLSVYSIALVPFLNQNDTRMPNITLKDVPEELHRRLKEQAERHRRSMNSEAIWILERALQSTRRDADTIIAEAEALNRSVDVDFDPALIEKEKRREGLA